MLHKSLVSIMAVGLIVALLAFAGLACAKSPSPTVSPTTSPTVSATATGQENITVTSSIDAGHSHDVTISGADIENPPAADDTIDTTYSGGHRHTITLTRQDYESIKNGDEVTVISSSSGGHAHTFVIAK